MRRPKIWVNIGSGNGLFPNGTNSLLEQMGQSVIIWTSVDLSSKVICGIHLRAVSQEVLVKLIRNMCLETTLSTTLDYLSWAN